MKFLVDNQLPSALAGYVRKKGFDCEHVLDAGLADNGFVIISKDEDFLYLAGEPNATFQLLWVRLGNCRTGVLLEAFDRVWPEVGLSLSAGERVVEVR